MVLKSEELRQKLTLAVQEDSAAFDQYMTAAHMPKETLEQQQMRDEAIEKATVAAIEAPAKTAKLAIQVMNLALAAVKYGNINAISDGASAAQCAIAGFHSAVLNVRINLKNLRHPESVSVILEEMDALKVIPDQINEQIADILADRAGIQF